MPRLGAVLASKAFIISAILRPALKTYNAAGAIKGGGIKASSFSLFSSFSFFSSSTEFAGITERGQGRRSGSKALKIRA